MSTLAVVALHDSMVIFLVFVCLMYCVCVCVFVLQTIEKPNVLGVAPTMSNTPTTTMTTTTHTLPHKTQPEMLITIVCVQYQSRKPDASRPIYIWRGHTKSNSRCFSMMCVCCVRRVFSVWNRKQMRYAELSMRTDGRRTRKPRKPHHQTGSSS